MGVVDTAGDWGEQDKSGGLPKRDAVWKDGDLGCPSPRVPGAIAEQGQGGPGQVAGGEKAAGA